MKAILLILFLSIALSLSSKVKLPAILGDNMVLQQKSNVKLWGTASSLREISIVVSWDKKKYFTKSDKDGKWIISIRTFKAGGPYEIKITEDNSIVLRNILIGEVWLCSGQSNMGFSVRGSENAEQDISNAQYPSIRFFTVAQNPMLTPSSEVKGVWQSCSPQTVADFSGAAYFFGRELYKKLKIPIGLVHSSVGGTPAEAWIRREALSSIPTIAVRAENEVAQFRSQEEDNKKFIADRDTWEQKYGVKPPPIKSGAIGWADPALDTGDWEMITLPAQWGQLGQKSGGVFWVRKEVVLPELAAGKPFSLSLNWLSEQYDIAFFNGVEIGRVSDKAPAFYNLQRSYQVPGKLVKAGRNVIAVRIVSATERAGMWQWGYAMGFPVANRTSIDDQWLMKTESVFAPLPADAINSRPKPNNIPFRNVSSSLYNGMIAPLIPFAIKGAIWYQGESNASRYEEYSELLSLLVRDWRAQWGQGDFPFIIQQLVNNGTPSTDPNKRMSWPFIREAQMQVADNVSNCGIAVGIELGSSVTIHPPNKQDVGKRLALVALEKTYGQKMESSGPRYHSMKIEGNTIRVMFTHAKGLLAKGGPLKTFTIAGEDKKFYWADAKINGAAVVVSSPQVPNPVTVRYAWADNPEGCNLYNAAGLPASPFRTDITEKPEKTANTTK